VFGLTLYAVAFQGLLGPWDGAFGGIWILLTFAYALFHTGFCLLVRTVLRPATLAICLAGPFAIVAYEYIRHLMTWAYDGCGLTFCLVGQSWVDQRILLQCTDVGGVWLLSFGVACVTSMLVLSLASEIPWKRRLWWEACGAFLIVAFVAYGMWAAAVPIQKSHSGWVVTAAESFTRESVSRIDRLIRQQLVSVERPDWLCVVGPETALSWDSSDSSQSQSERDAQYSLTQLTQEHSCQAIVGAWVGDGSGNSVRNSAVLLQSGRLLSIVDKQHQVPFVEGRPLGTGQLNRAGLIPLGASRDIAPAQPVDIVALERANYLFRPGVCYDLFFAEQYQRPGGAVGSPIVCCLDESFDGNGVFRKLSRLHAKLRAVEFRSCVIRCSLGGNTAVIDCSGNTLTPQLKRDNLFFYKDVGGSKISFYARSGDWFPRISCVLVIVLPFGQRLLAGWRVPHGGPTDGNS